VIRDSRIGMLRKDVKEISNQLKVEGVTDEQLGQF
jgi:hypothetical protein